MLPNSSEANPQNPSGGTQQPATPPSGNEANPLPDYVKALQDQNATLLQQFTELGNQVKGLQKGTDKQIGQVRGDIKRILELRESGMNESQIQRELWIDSQMNDRDVTIVPNGGGPAQPNTSLDMEPVLKSLKFAENDPALAALRIKYQGKELLEQAANLRIAQLTASNPTPGTAIPQEGFGGVSDQTRVEQETANYLKELQESQGKGYQHGDAVKAKYRQKGVPVDSLTIKIG